MMSSTRMLLSITEASNSHEILNELMLARGQTKELLDILAPRCCLKSNKRNKEASVRPGVAERVWLRLEGVRAMFK